MGALFTLNVEKTTAERIAVASSAGISARLSWSTHGLPRPMKTLPMSFEYSAFSEPACASHMLRHAAAATFAPSLSSARASERAMLRRRR